MITVNARCLLLLAVALALGPGSLPAGLIFNRHAKPEGPETLVVTDMFQEERPPELEPSPDHPVPYIVLGGMENDIGPTWAGERMPDVATIRAELIKVLATQGYVETKVGGPVPKLVLAFSYGTASRDPDIDNRRQMSNLVGAAKADRHLMSGTEADQMNEAMRNDRLYIMVAALDPEALRVKKKKLIWRTSISIESLRNSLPDHLGLMLAEAGPYFGRETDRPVFRDDDDRNAKVKLGELKFLDDKTPPPAEPPKNQPTGKR